MQLHAKCNPLTKYNHPNLPQLIPRTKWKSSQSLQEHHSIVALLSQSTFRCHPPFIVALRLFTHIERRENVTEQKPSPSRYIVYVVPYPPTLSKNESTFYRVQLLENFLPLHYITRKLISYPTCGIVDLSLLSMKKDSV